MFHTQSTSDFSVAEHYGLRNTTCLYSEDVACEELLFPFFCNILLYFDLILIFNNADRYLNFMQKFDK
jgi:hypothetical protein